MPQQNSQYTHYTQYAIRRATKADAIAISKLITDSAKQFITPDYTEQGKNTMLNSLVPQAIMENFENGMCYWLAEISIDNKDKNELSQPNVIGVISLKPPTHLFHLFVEADYHGQGIGRALWQRLLTDNDWTEATTITVNASRFALPFYRSLGFQSKKTQAEQICKDGVICYPLFYQYR